MLGSLLTSENRYTSISRLVDAVWGTNPPSTAGKQIRNAVSDLRSVLASSGAVITPVADGYRLGIGTAQLDLLTFHEHLARARTHLSGQRRTDAIAEFRAALSLWTGPMLSGIESGVLQAQMAGVNETRLAAIEECIDLELACGRHNSLISELAGWVAEYPLRERMVAQYVLALHRSGDRARAFGIYERTRRQLAEQLGLSPGPELLEVHQLMLREDAAAPALPRPTPTLSSPRPDPAAAPVTVPAPAPALDSLPPRIGHFVGRTAEIRTLLGEAERPAPQRVLAIDGMPGAGKTAFAVHMAHWMANQYPDGQHFLDLRGHSPAREPLDHRTALHRLLRLSGVTETHLPHRAEQLAALWRAHSTDLRLLLVLDNAASAEQIRPLLPAGDACLTLVTSRRRLTMTTWSATRVLSLGPLPRPDGYELFCRVLGNQHPRPEPAAVDGILALCGGLPLAISAAAARLRRRPSWSLTHLAERLADPRMRLANLQTEQGSLSACFDASYRHLNAGQQRLLRILGAADGHNSDVMTASALADLPPYVAEHMLEDLVDEHLLLQPEPGRYRMHPLVKTYCAQLREPGRAPGTGPVRKAAPGTLATAGEDVLRPVA
ncbi:MULTISPECIES: BTAD domain-containing putative transcriptional regulator [unclassified Streptomyces]|uniref:AfsR/SARP family transcriptional regulator n=1 Tax=unclassified Streptomyces TaxID=2593676 RepID=UPI00381EB9F8